MLWTQKLYFQTLKSCSYVYYIHKHKILHATWNFLILCLPLKKKNYNIFAISKTTILGCDNFDIKFQNRPLKLNISIIRHVHTTS